MVDSRWSMVDLSSEALAKEDGRTGDGDEHHLHGLGIEVGIVQPNLAIPAKLGYPFPTGSVAQCDFD
jgi:hypothetical protein